MTFDPDQTCAAIANAVSRAIPAGLRCKVHVNATGPAISPEDVTIELRPTQKVKK